MQLSIGELANLAREPVKTLRYWSDQGLLDSQRGDNGYRYYQPEMVERVSFIRNTQALGFRLDDIKGILKLRGEGVKPCAEVREELQEHLTTVKSRIAELQALEFELAGRLAWAKANPDPECDGEGCVYL